MINEAKLNLRPLDLVIPLDIQAILELIQKNCQFAVLAGGYLRDSYYRKSPKDLDIFIGVKEPIAVHNINSALTNILVNNGWATEVDSSDNFEYEKEKQILHVSNFTKKNILPLQLIFSEKYTDLESVLKTFDFGFCQIGYDGKTVLVTDHFWKDAVNSTATLIRQTNNYRPRKERFMKKYPNIKWIEPC
jgi:hypothetical protein